MDIDRVCDKCGGVLVIHRHYEKKDGAINIRLRCKDCHGISAYEFKDGELKKSEGRDKGGRKPMNLKMILNIYRIGS